MTNMFRKTSKMMQRLCFVTSVTHLSRPNAAADHDNYDTFGMP